MIFGVAWSNFSLSGAIRNNMLIFILCNLMIIKLHKSYFLKCNIGDIIGTFDYFKEFIIYTYSKW